MAIKVIISNGPLLNHLIILMSAMGWWSRTACQNVPQQAAIYNTIAFFYIQPSGNLSISTTYYDSGLYMIFGDE